MTPRRLALVVGQLQVGGAERQLFHLASRLDRARYDPFVVCLSEVSEPFASMLRARGVEVELLARAGHRDVGRARRLSRLLGQRGTDLAHAFLLAANAYTFAATRLALRPGRRRPYIASSRTCIPARGAVTRMICARAFRSARAVIANSRRVMEFTRDEYGVDERKMRVIPNGVDLDLFPADGGPARAAARELLGLPPDALAIGCVGRLSPEKNPALFVDLAARLARRDGTLRFVLIGDGPQMAELRARSARLGLEGRLLFAGERPEIAPLLAGLDLLVSPSDTEGMPNAVMEAMAAGLGVVATRVGGTAELVEPDVTGYLVDRRDVEALDLAVTRLIADADLRRAMGSRGRARVARDFSVDAMVASTTALYDEVLG